MGMGRPVSQGLEGHADSPLVHGELSAFDALEGHPEGPMEGDLEVLCPEGEVRGLVLLADDGRNQPSLGFFVLRGVEVDLPDIAVLGSPVEGVGEQAPRVREHLKGSTHGNAQERLAKTESPSSISP